jgi:hypothetical protein
MAARKTPLPKVSEDLCLVRLCFDCLLYFPTIRRVWHDMLTLEM